MADGKKNGGLSGINIVGKIVGALVALWLISISYFAFSFFLLGMIPAIMAMMMDRGHGRFASKTVTACNFVGILPFLFEIGLDFERDIAAKNLMADYVTWVTVYGFASIGWLMIWVVPQLTLVIFTLRWDVRREQLHELQEELLEEWGEEVKTGAKRAPLSAQKE